MCHCNPYQLYRHTEIKLTAYFKSRCQSSPSHNALSFSGCEKIPPHFSLLTAVLRVRFVGRCDVPNKSSLITPPCFNEMLFCYIRDDTKIQIMYPPVSNVYFPWEDVGFCYHCQTLSPTLACCGVCLEQVLESPVSIMAGGFFW